MRFPGGSIRTPCSSRKQMLVGRTCATVCFFSLLSSLAFSASTTQPGARSALVRTGSNPGIRFNSGLTVCDEELRNGRWVSRYWDSSGQVIADIQIDAERQQMDLLPVDAFKLEIEGQNLSGTWKWIGASKSEVHNPDGLLVTAELESSVRPIRVKLQTLLSGGPVMVRWLEVQNTGQRPTAISNVSPWSGQLWHTPNYVEKLHPDSANVYDVGYAQYDKWGYEGAWRFDPVVNETKIISGDRGKSGWGHPTFFARNNATGEWFVASLAWSANWKIRVTSKVEKSPVDRSDSIDRPVNDARLFFEMGPSSFDPVLRVLEPGESVKTPETHILCMKSDLDHVTQALLTTCVVIFCLARLLSTSSMWKQIIAVISSITKLRKALIARSTWRPTSAPKHSSSTPGGMVLTRTTGMTIPAIGTPAIGCRTTSSPSANMLARRECVSDSGLRLRPPEPHPNCAKSIPTGF